MPPDPRPLLLIVEDNRVALDALDKLVSDAGWRVVKARTGFEAATHLHSGIEPPDAVLVDLMIPDPPGEAIVRMIRDMKLASRRTNEPVRIVAYTGVDSPGVPGHGHPITQAFEAGIDAVVLKPATLEHTLAVVRGDHPGDVPLPNPKGTP